MASGEQELPGTADWIRVEDSACHDDPVTGLDRVPLATGIEGPSVVRQGFVEFTEQIDAIEKRPRQPIPMTGNGRSGTTAVAPAASEPTTAAGVHGGEELKIRRPFPAPSPSNHTDPALLERLTQGIEDAVGEFRQLVEEQDAVMGQRRLTRLHTGAPANEPSSGDTVVRSPEGPWRAAQATVEIGVEPESAGDPQHIDGVTGGHFGLQNTHGSTEASFTTAGSTDQQHVVTSGGRCHCQMAGMGVDKPQERIAGTTLWRKTGKGATSGRPIGNRLAVQPGPDFPESFCAKHLDTLDETGFDELSTRDDEASSPPR